VRSLWRAHYELEIGGQTVFEIRDENPRAKVADGLLSEIPFLAISSGHLLHPR
jgi:hypothetical protein